MRGRAPRAVNPRPALAERLPAHPVPAIVTALDALPLTASGKLDRAALRDRRAGRSSRAATGRSSDALGARRGPGSAHLVQMGARRPRPGGGRGNSRRNRGALREAVERADRRTRPTTRCRDTRPCSPASCGSSASPTRSSSAGARAGRRTVWRSPADSRVAASAGWFAGAARRSGEGRTADLGAVPESLAPFGRDHRATVVVVELAQVAMCGRRAGRGSPVSIAVSRRASARRRCWRRADALADSGRSDF